MKNKKLIFNISISVFSILILLIITLALLGKKERIGYLSDFNLNIDKTLRINGLDINKTKQLFTIDNKLDITSITNYIFTNNSITNYSYDFRIKYYSKVFRNSDIYSVYPKIDIILNDNSFIKEIKMDKEGSPFGDLISSQILDFEKIDNIKYNLKLKDNIVIFTIFLILPLIYIIIKFVFSIFNLFIEYFNNLFFNKINANNFYLKEINKRHDNSIYIIVFIIFFPIIFLLYESIYSSFPYYYSWDSSQIYAKDILLVSSGLFPEHLIHPNMVPLVLYKYIFIPIGKLFKIISISNITELENSLNPHLSFTEFVEYILMICRVSFFLFIAIMYINIIRIMKIDSIIENKFFIFIFSLSLLIILSISKFVYNAGIFFTTVIRYETIGLVLASISLYFTISSSNTINLNDNKHRLFLILSGIFIGAALLSKIMFAGWVIGIFIIYILLNLDKYFYCQNEYKKDIGIIFNILILSTILIIALNIFISIYFNNDKLLSSAFISGIKKEILVYIQIIVPVFFIILSIITYLIKRDIIKANSVTKNLLSNFIIYVLSCFFTILLSLLLPMAIDTLFTTYIFSYAGGSIISLFNNAGVYSHYTKRVSIFILFFIILLIVIFTYVIKNKKILFKNIVTVNIILNIILIIFSFIFLKALRNNGSDRVITISLLVLSIFLLVNTILKILYNFKIFKFMFFIVLAFIAVRVLTININLLRYSPTTSAYVCDLNTWKTYSYGYKNGARFANLFKKNYPSDESWNYAIFWSNNIKQIRRLLTQIRINNNSLNDTIIAYTNSRIDKDSKNIISKIDNNLNGGLILQIKDDNNTVYLREDYYFYFISDIEYKKDDKRIIFTDYDFYINDKKYFVYKLNMNTWRELNYGYNGNFTFKKEEDFNIGFILINDRLSKRTLINGKANTKL